LLKSVKLLVFILVSLLPSITVLHFLSLYFPNTGLARVGTLPSTYFLNIILIVAAYAYVRRSRRWWILIIVIPITMLIAIFLWPQEYEPSVISQLWHADLNKR
jgi:hypothetical protein